MSSHLCLFLMALHALTPLVTSSCKTKCTSKCKGDGVQVAVDGWPVLAALRVPLQAKVTMNLSLSHNHEEHTHLTLTHRSLEDKVGVIQATLKSQMAETELNTAALLHDSALATLKIIARHKELELRIDSEDRFSKYSTSASLNTTLDLHVNKVTCSGPMCGRYIDIQCLYRKSNHTKEHKASPNKSTPDRKVYYWVFYVMMSLLVVVCLLFLVWRNERKKFRTRWSRHSQVIRRISSIPNQEENPRQADRRSGVVEWRAGTNEGQCNLAYDNTNDP